MLRHFCSVCSVQVHFSITFLKPAHIFAAHIWFVRYAFFHIHSLCTETHTIKILLPKYPNVMNYGAILAMFGILQNWPDACI